MDLNDAIALLDETCPNPDASPSLITKKQHELLNTRNKRARSKSSDNSKNLSCEKINDKKRPFLRKIGISKTEDRPFLLSKLTPRIIGKPYLEKIGPSKAVERPFLDKIGPSRTLDKFTFEALKELPRSMIRRTHTTVETSTIQRTKCDYPKDNVLVVEEVEEPDTSSLSSSHNNTNNYHHHSDGIERKRSGKGLLLKMYSFDSDDLNDVPSTSMKINQSSLDKTNEENENQDENKQAEIENELQQEDIEYIEEEEEEIMGPKSLPQIKNNNNNNNQFKPELVKCRVTTSEEIISGSSENIEISRETSSWSNTPKLQMKKLTTTTKTTLKKSNNENSDDESIPNSPTKRRISKVSPEPQLPIRIIPVKTKNSSLPRDIDLSPKKTRRQESEEKIDKLKFNELKYIDDNNRIGSGELIQLSFRKKKFNDNIEKFGGSNFKNSITRRQISEDILDKTELVKTNTYCKYIDDRMGISSDNLQYSRETIVESAPSASSLGYQSGDSSFTSYRSSNNSQDMLRCTFKLLQNKYELQDVPAESYAAFKLRTRGNYHSLDRYKYFNKNTTTTTTKTTVDNSTSINKQNNDQDNVDDDDDDDKPKVSHESRLTETIIDKNMKRSGTIKSVLRKQNKIDIRDDEHDNITSSSSSIKNNNNNKKLIHEPSQETMELLTELKKVKSLLKTPSEEKCDWDCDGIKVRIPKKISLSDKEFCLSVERENSIRRVTSIKLIKDNCKKIDEIINDIIIKDDDVDVDVNKSHGPSLFEKKCLSLDYADDVKSIKLDPRAISLASERTTPKSDDDETAGSPGSCLLCESKSCLSDVFIQSPGEKNDDESTNNKIDIKKNNTDSNNKLLDIDIAIPIDIKRSISPRRRFNIQGRTSDVYEIISPRTTPFRMKKRLGRISVEESVKQESFTLDDKVDCKTITVHKKTKCFPL